MFGVVLSTLPHFRPGSGVLLEIAIWVLDMAFHLWFLLVDCTRVVSSLYFKNRPLQILHCVILFIFHLQILRFGTPSLIGLFRLFTEGKKELSLPPVVYPFQFEDEDLVLLAYSLPVFRQ